MKRIAAFLLAIAIVLSATPFVFAETTSEDPTTTVSGINIYCETDYETFASGQEYVIKLKVSNPSQVVAVISCNLSLEGMEIVTVGDGDAQIDPDAGTISITTSQDSCTLMNVQVDDNAEGEVTANLTNIQINGTSVEDYSLTIPVVEFAAEEIGGEKYAYLSDAIAAAAQGTGEVKLLRDVELTETLVVAKGQDIILDLAGFTVSMNQAETVTANHEMVQNNGKLTIRDSSAEKTGALVYTYTGEDTDCAICTIVNNCATLIVEECKIQNASTPSNSNNFAIDSRTNGNGGDASVEILGGSVVCDTFRSLRIYANSDSNIATARIKDATMVGQVWLQSPNAKQNKASLTIESGSFEPMGRDGSSVYITTASSTAIDLKISDGTFKTKIGIDNAANVSGFITGGEFKVDPTNYVADGYTVAYNNGYFVVSKKVTVDNGTENPSNGAESKGEASPEVENAGVTDEKVQEAVNSNQQTNENLADIVAADTVASAAASSVDKNAAATQIQEAYGGTVTEDNVTVEVRPYLDVKAETYEEAQIHEDLTTMQGTANVTAKTLTLEITPKYDVVAVAGDKALVVSSGTMTNVTEKVSITIPVPADFVGENENPYVKHTKDDDTVYIYAATYDSENHTLTFENPNGFSTFEAISTTSELQVYGSTQLPEFYGTNLTLGNVNDISFFIEKSKLAEYALNDLMAYITVDNGSNRNETVEVKEYDATYYRVRVTNIPAAEMCDNITVVIKKGDVEVTKAKTITMAQALLDLYNAYDDVNDGEKWQNLAVAMLRYGAMAQIAFNHNTSNLATDYIPNGVQ